MNDACRMRRKVGAVTVDGRYLLSAPVQTVLVLHLLQYQLTLGTHIKHAVEKHQHKLVQCVKH